MEQYTPGPWRVCTCKVGEEPYYVSDTIGKIVFQSSGTVKLDAKIFAAAPDLLAALEAVVDDLLEGLSIAKDDGATQDWLDAAEERLQNAYAAIRKARGME